MKESVDLLYCVLIEFSMYPELRSFSELRSVAINFNVYNQGATYQHFTKQCFVKYPSRRFFYRIFENSASRLLRSLKLLVLVSKELHNLIVLLT